MEVAPVQQAAVPTSEIVDPAEVELEKEVDRIQKTAEMQLASVKGLNLSLVKKIRKAEAQAITLLNENKNLEDKNAALVLQLERAQEEMRSLLIKEENLASTQAHLDEAKKTVVAKELAVKKTEADRDALLSEKDALESTLATLRVRLDATDAALAEERVSNENERGRLGKEVQDRDLALTNLSTERDLASKEKSDIEEQLRTKDTEILDLQDRIVLLTTQAEKRQQEFDAEVAALIEYKDKASADYEASSRELDTLRTQHGSVVDEKDRLESEIATLASANSELALKIETYEKELEESKALLVSFEMERETLKQDAEDKAREVVELTAIIAGLTAERNEFLKARDDLESQLGDAKTELDAKTIELNDKHESFTAAERSLGDTKKHLEDRDIELEDKKQAYSSLEGEKNLLAEAVAQLEKDYEEARKYEKRMYELEEEEKKLLQTIAALEAEKIALVEEHHRELNEQLLKAQEEYAMHTVKLRKEIDDIVDRHAAIGLEELEPPVEGTTVFTEPAAVKSVPTVQTPAVMTSEMDDDAEEFKDANPDDGTLDRAIGLHTAPELPTNLPTFPQEEPETVKPTGGETMVMTRDEDEDNDYDEDSDDDVEDDDDDEPKIQVDAVKEAGPGEGNTAPVVAEEVVEEMVVDDVRDSDDVLVEVDEEVPVPDAEAEGARKALGGVMTPGEQVGNAAATDNTAVQGPIDGTDKVDDVTTSAKEVSNDDVRDADVKAKELGLSETDPTTETAAGYNDPFAEADGTRGLDEDGSKKSSGILQKLRCCTGGEQGPDTHAI